MGNAEPPRETYTVLNAPPIPFCQYQIDENGQIIVSGFTTQLENLFGIEHANKPIPLLELLTTKHPLNQSGEDGEIIHSKLVNPNILKFHLEALEKARGSEGEFVPPQFVYDLNGRFIIGTMYQNGTMEFRDYTQEMRILQMAVEGSRDSLTQLYNRDRVITEMRKAIENGEEYAICFIDIDYFKDINDQYSHGYGDLKIAEVGRVLRQCVRSRSVIMNREIFEAGKSLGFNQNVHYIKLFSKETDSSGQPDERFGDAISLDSGDGYPTRWGGDEFVIFLKGVKKEDLPGVIERIQSSLNKITYGEGAQRRNLPISIGSAHSSEYEINKAEDLVDKADSLMYRMKLDHHIQRVRDLFSKRSNENRDPYADKKIEEFDRMVSLVLAIYDRSPTSINKLDIMNVVEFIILHLDSYYNVVGEYSEADGPPNDLNMQEIMHIQRERLKLSLVSASISKLIGGSPELVEELRKEIDRYEGKDVSWDKLSIPAKIVYLVTRYNTRAFSSGGDTAAIIERLKKEVGDDEILKLLALILNPPIET